MSLPVMRRIVTGHNAEGKAVIVSADAPPNIIPFAAVPGTVFYEIWNTNQSPAPIDNGADPTLRPLQLHPTPQGSIIRFVDIPPDTIQNQVSDADIAAAFAQMGAAKAIKDNGGPDGEARHKIMHRTETIDYGILIAGELWLVLDEGETKLNVGDVVIQRGTNHAWSNRTNEIARMVFILLDGKFAEGRA